MIFSFILLQSVEKKRMQTAKEKLASVEYHPLREFNLTVHPVDENDMRRKRLKNFIKCKLLSLSTLSMQFELLFFRKKQMPVYLSWDGKNAP